MRRALVVLVLALAAAVAVPSTAAGQTATPRCSPAPTNCTGWYATDVRLSWSVSAVYSQDCDNNAFTRDGVWARTCLVRNSENVNWTSIPVTVRIDKTAPVVTGVAPSRGPDANGWYRSPVAVTFFGTDRVPGADSSGIARCSSVTYGGPDAVGAQVVGRCWDVAGNASAPYVYALNYDSTPPAVINHSAEGGDGIVRLRWAVSAATQVEVWRSPGRKGAAQSVVSRGTEGTAVDRRVRNGRRYDYKLVALDEAGNVALSTFSATPGRRLLAPASGARLDAPPVLRWTRVRGAEYYNVQLFRGKHKVLSAWQKKPRLELTRAWRFGGDRHRLKPGRRYTWLVWPGRGKRSRNDYGQLIGRGTFTVAAA
jgi:hypothetical protein